MMNTENIKTAWRRLKNNKFYTAINVLGLAVSLAAAILIILWVQDERSFDQFHHDHEQVYKINSHLVGNGTKNVWQGSPSPVANFARENANVEIASRITYDGNATLRNDSTQLKVSNMRVLHADKEFFSLFNFPLRSGQVSTLFQQPKNAFITQSTAIKLYGDENVIGEIFHFDEEQFTVVGIMEDFPQNSSIQANVILPLSYYAQRFTEYGGNGNWKTIDEDLGNYGFYTYMKLSPTASSADVASFVNQAFIKARDGVHFVDFSLDRLDQLHLVGADGNKSALHVVQIFSIIAILLLTIGAINYVNLSTARSMERAKGIGIRKVIGASKKQLFFLFSTETIVIFLTAILLAVTLVFLCVPAYNEISGKSLTFSLGNVRVWLYIIAAVVVTLLLAAIYPALQLSSFNAISALKGQLGNRFSSQTLRKTLVVFQFSISITLIISTLIIGKQLQYLREINLGYDREHVFTVSLPYEAVQHIDAIHQELASSSAIQSTSLTEFYNLMDYGNSTGDLEWSGKPASSSIIVGRARVDQKFIPLMGLEFVEGKNFGGVPADSAAFVVNEELVKQMGLQAPYVGTEMSLHGIPGKIIGVLKNFNFRSLKEKVSPIVLWTHAYSSILYVKTSANKTEEAIAAVAKVYEKYPSEKVFNYQFLDSQFDELYKSDNRTGLLFNIFSGIAIFISVLGLFALTTYAAQIRIKEIGIRKVLGADVLGIMHLLSKDFILLVLIAIVIACPVAWYLMNEWLSSFSYRTSISIYLFVSGGIMAVALAYITIGLRAMQAALANPVKSLRDE